MSYFTNPFGPSNTPRVAHPVNDGLSAGARVDYQPLSGSNSRRGSHHSQASPHLNHPSLVASRRNSQTPTPTHPNALNSGRNINNTDSLPINHSRSNVKMQQVDFSRRKSVDVGVLGVGTHRLNGGSRRVRDAVGPDAGDKETGLPEGRDSALGRHLASILSHSLSLCQDSMSTRPSTAKTQQPESVVGIEEVEGKGAFPVLEEAQKYRLILSLQSWSFNAMSYTSDQLLVGVSLLFECLLNMEGVSFDLLKLRALLLSLRAAYHARNGYHNFTHATDVTQACYSFLVKLGLAPPLYLLGEDSPGKWRRTCAVENVLGQILRPMDVFALMLAAIGHDVGHPGLSNAYMVNARTPVAQVYEDKSVLENFHTVTLIHMLRRHRFEDLLGGKHGSRPTSFRKVIETAILATDMSKHFSYVNQLNDLGRRLAENRSLSRASIESDRLLLAAGLIKCADISNPTRPHGVSKAWSTALLDEWAVQAAIEKEFGLPVTVMTVDPNDVRGQAKSQIGFIDLFVKPLFSAMNAVVPEFNEYCERLRDGRVAWETTTHSVEEPFRATPTPMDWKLSQPTSRLHETTRRSPLSQAHNAPREESNVLKSSSSRESIGRPLFKQRMSGASIVTDSSPSSSLPSSPFSPGFHLPDVNSCGGACHAATAICETCSRRQDPRSRRESLGRSGAGLLLAGNEKNIDLDTSVPIENTWPGWPFLPGAFSPAPPLLSSA